MKFIGTYHIVVIESKEHWYCSNWIIGQKTEIYIDKKKSAHLNNIKEDRELEYN